MPINRRNFIKQSALLGSGSMLGGEALAKGLPALNFAISTDFKLKVLATNWGFQGNMDSFCAKAKESGYDGIELWWPNKEDQQKALFLALEKHELEYGFLATGSGNEFKTHLETFKKTLEAATSKKPLFINCHSGKDYFSFEQSKEIIETSIEISKKTGVPIYHETHRARILFAAHITRQFIETIPELRLTLDISHWVNVHSSYLNDQQDTVQLALDRSDHVHSRVGQPQAPQITDPRAPEWEGAMKTHFAWWDKVVENKAKNGGTLTMTTEFGPPDYMPTIPFTRQPMADLWDVNTHMMKLWKERYV